ncbi:hypothetical protein AAG570_000718 [Ranatra chinensis]|uniref:Uncharacterized protein n=1 Tax=Ranatra chinensis TaxID=642074 RepID=A0ABD0YXV3_9HEMI
MTNAGAIVLSPVIGEKAVDEEKEVYSISKCCKMNETYDKDGKCHPDSTPFTPEFYGPEPDTVDIIEGLTCDYGSYRLYPEEDENDEFHLLTNGSLYLPNMEVVTQLVPPGSYCLENFTSTDGHSELLALLCFPSPVAGFQWKKAAMTLYSIGCLFSVPFLALTSIVYWWVQALSDVRGRVLATHTACLMVAFIFLVYVQTMGADLPHVPCVIVGNNLENVKKVYDREP